MKKTLFSLLALGSVVLPSSALEFREWEEASGGNGHNYTVIGETVEEVMTWPEARTQAELLNGYLVTIESSQELDFIRRVFGSEELFWIGLHSDDGSGAFVWVNDEYVDFTQFQGTQPSADVDSAVVINLPGRGARSLGDFGALNPTDSDYRAIVEFDLGVDPSQTQGSVPDAGNTLALVFLSGLAGMFCRFLKR